jgi:hypothetical protein
VERAVLSLAPENIITIGFMMGILYLAAVAGYQVYKRLGGQPFSASVAVG